MRGQTDDVVAVKGDLAGGGPIKAAHHVEHGGFAGPVGADEAQEFAALQGQIEVMNSAESAEVDPQMSNVQKRHLNSFLL